MENKIYNEDCFETMKRMEDNSIDLIVTSPPYNGVVNNHMYIVVGEEFGDPNKPYKRYDEYQDSKTTSGYLEWSVNLFNEFDRVVKPNRPILYNFSYNSTEPMLPYWLVNEIYNNTPWMVVDTIAWKKPKGFPNMISPNKLSRKWEFVFVLCRKDEIKTFEIREREYTTKSNGTRRYKTCPNNFIEAKNNDGFQTINKATYSSDLVKQLLDRYANDGYVVYDPFIGTGTTAIACIDYGLDYIGNEISAEQCEFAENRIKEHTSPTKKNIERMLDSYVERGYWNLSVYEDSCNLIDKHFPNHELSDYELEEITYEWLEK